MQESKCEKLIEVTSSCTFYRPTWNFTQFVLGPLWIHAPLSDPGGVLNTRLSASRTAAFRPLHTVGVPSLQLEDYPMDHDSTYFGAPSRGLHPRSLQLRTPIAGFARGFHY